MTTTRRHVDPIELRFNDGTTARVATHYSPSLDDHMFLIDHNGRPTLMLDNPDAAERLGYALLAQAAAARGISRTHRICRALATATTHLLDRVAPGTRVGWTDKWNGTARAGVVEKVENWRGQPEAHIDTDTDAPHKVTSIVAVSKLTPIPDGTDPLAEDMRIPALAGSEVTR